MNSVQLIEGDQKQTEYDNNREKSTLERKVNLQIDVYGNEQISILSNSME